MDTTITMPFGAHKGKNVVEIPTGYLSWLVRECQLSSTLRATVAAELARRGISTPPAPPPRPIPPCERCGPEPGYCVHWLEARNGTRRLRAECDKCHRNLACPPCVEPFVSMANAAKSATPILDALTRLEDLGVTLRSDGRSVSFQSSEDYHRCPPELRATIRGCSHTLALLLGDTKGAAR